jgi:hypothetical protein
MQVGHFTYITTYADEHKKQLQSYYKLIEEDLEEITKEWLTNLLITTDPVKIFDVDSPETLPTHLDQERRRNMMKCKMFVAH